MTGVKPSKLIDYVYKPIEFVSDTLERKLGIVSVVIISLSAMLGSGLFVLPALAMLDLGGSGIWLAYVVAALVVLPGALSKSELATAMPTSGGDYIYIERTYGPLFGTIAGLGLWASFLLKAAFALIGFSAYLWVIEPIIGFNIYIQGAAITLLVLVVIVNILGVKQIKNVQIPIVAVSILFLVGLCIKAVISSEMDWNRPISDGAFGDGWTSVAETAAFVFVSYAGVTKIAAIAEGKGIIQKLEEKFGVDLSTPEISADEEEEDMEESEGEEAKEVEEKDVRNLFDQLELELCVFQYGLVKLQ